METIWFIGGLALFVAASQFVLGPFVLYFTTRLAAKPQFQSFDLVNPPLLLPPSYAENNALLEELGFSAVAHLFAARHSTSVRYVHTLLVNQSEKDMAVVVHMLGEIPPVTRMAVNYVEFFTDFEDGSEINTINSKQPGGFVQVPEKRIFRLPHLIEPKQLYAVHRALLAQRAAVSKRLPAAGAEVSYMVAGIERDLAREASFGGLRLDYSGLWYRPTMKGAILMAWTFGWPIGFLRRRLLRWRGKRLARAVLSEQS
jgi:hypothetical protein